MTSTGVTKPEVSEEEKPETTASRMTAASVWQSACVACVVFVVCVAASGPSDPFPPTVSVDIPPPTTVYASSLKAVQPLLSCVGSGHASLTLREDWRSQFTRTVQDIGFSFVRYHAILDDDMSTYLNGGANMYNVGVFTFPSFFRAFLFELLL